MRHADVPHIALARQHIGHRLVGKIVIQHAAAPHRGVQLGKRNLRTAGLIQQGHVTPRFAKIHTLHHRALVPTIVVADNNDRRTRHPR